MSQYQKGKTNLDFTEARNSEWQWHQLGHMHVCTLFQTDNHASNPPLSFFAGQMPFLLPNQQRQSTEGIIGTCIKGKGGPYSITDRRVLELIPVFGSQPAGNVSHKPGGRLPLLSASPAVALTTLKRAAISFAAW